MDFSGPFEVSLQGNVYLVLFVDRATRLIIGFFVKNKDDDTAVGLIKRFIEENLSAPMFKGEVYEETGLVLAGEHLVESLERCWEAITTATFEPNLIHEVGVVDLGGRQRQRRMGTETGGGSSHESIENSS